MAIKLWIEGGETLTLIDDDNEIDNVECLEYLFKGEAFIDKTNGNYNANNMLFGLSHEERLSDYDGNYMLVRNAAWVDAGPPDKFSSVGTRTDESRISQDADTNRRRLRWRGLI